MTVNPAAPRGREVTVALIGAVAIVLCSAITGWVTWEVAQSNHPPQPAPRKSQALSINARDRLTSPSVHRGHAGDLVPGTSVWTFNEPFTRDGAAPSGTIYANPGPCPVDKDGNWECGPTYIGDAAKDKNRRFRVYVSVVTERDAFNIVRDGLVNTYNGGPILRGLTQPPRVQDVAPKWQDVTVVGFQ